MDPILIIVIVLSVLYIAYIVFEKLYNDKVRKSFKYVIHVNGIRGKSTTTRLIDAGFRECGYKVFSKTTGTFPTIVNTNNEIVPIKRLGPANIREQLKMMRRAYKEKAEVLVLECMAVNPELQYICEHRILNSDVTVITNVRMDHIGDMGNNLEELAFALSGTIPKNGTVILHDDNQIDIFKDVATSINAKIVMAKPYNEDDLMDTFRDNIENALEVCRVLGLDENTFLNGMKKYHHDGGAYKTIKLQNTLFLNALSVNDPESIKIMYDLVSEKFDNNKITILLNSRDDRPTRIIQHVELLKSINCKKIIVVGSGITFIRKRLEKENIQITSIKNIEDLLNEEIIFATGNIGGFGFKVLQYFENNGEEYDS